ncbi:hypothetical protein KQX54_005614 [Cotesia glomerata]|uniref:Uncharacterized protein n=1 Tax=Cotesia glomerata TaxID=32391 RepID=A0AAV7HZ40_COTGL|nr:hypothetical protein KQX54_005614 [Cotesia glomerata]
MRIYPAVNKCQALPFASVLSTTLDSILSFYHDVLFHPLPVLFLSYNPRKRVRSSFNPENTSNGIIVVLQTKVEFGVIPIPRIVIDHVNKSHATLEQPTTGYSWWNYFDISLRFQEVNKLLRDQR